MDVSKIWSKNYKSGRFNKYPYDNIVTFVKRNFKDNLKKTKIKILDLGCGGGNNIEFLKNEGFDFYGIDASPESIKIIKNKIGDGFDPNKIVEGDFNKLPFNNNFFNGIIDRASLGCNRSTNLKNIFSEIYRVLKPKGLLYSSDLCSLEHPDLKFASKIIDNDYLDFTEGVFHAAQQIHAFSAKELQSLTKQFINVDITHTSTKSITNNIEKIISCNYCLKVQKP